MSGGGPSAGTNGFLFCDLRGYTAFVEAHGDQAAAELLATYRALVRTAIAAHTGAEIKTEGDSVYVVFPAASAAVEAGLEIVRAAAAASTKTAPIRVGVGVHAGETVATTEGLVGGAVNIAARVCAKAQAGEVLVTDTVRALTRTYLPYRYTSLGTQTLKGIAGGIPLYRVEAVPSSARARLARQLGARRGRVALLAGLVVVALVAATGVYALNRPTDCLSLPASTKDVVARIDPARNCVVAVYPVGRRPGAIAEADGSLWVGNVDDWTLTRIDPETGSVLGWLGTPGSPISMGAQRTGGLYVLALDAVSADTTSSESHHRVAIVDPATMKLTGVRLLPIETRLVAGTNPSSKAAYTALASAGGWAWVVSPRGTVLRTNRTGLIDVDIETVGASRPGIVAAAGGTVWIGDENSPAVYRIDGPAARPSTLSLGGSGGTIAMAASDSDLWLLRKSGDLTRVDPSSATQRTTRLSGHPGGLAVGRDSVWILDSDARTVVAVDADSGAMGTPIGVGGIPRGAIVAEGFVWVTVAAP